MNGTSVNLPTVITRQGGAIEQVVRELDLYTDQRYPLTRQHQYALGRLIEARPSLNNEHHVSLLVDALSFHGVDSAPELGRVIDEFGLPVAHLALDYLYEVGKRGRGREEYTDWFSPAGIRSVCQLLVNLDAEGHEVDTVEAFSEVIFTLGGLEEATTMTESEMTEVIRRANENDGANFDNQEDPDGE